MTDISKEAVERLASVFDKKAGAHDAGTVAASFDLEVAATLRALQARVEELEAQCVKVKPLEWWSPSATNNWTHGAKTIFGTYYVGICGGRYSAGAEFFHESGDIEQFDGPNRGSLLEAQLDAQAHHNARILSQTSTRSASDVWQEGFGAAIKGAIGACKDIEDNMQTNGKRKRYTALQATYVGKDFARFCRDDVASLKGKIPNPYEVKE